MGRFMVNFSHLRFCGQGQDAECGRKHCPGCDQLSCTPLPVSASFRAESGSTYTRIHHLTHALEGVEELPVPPQHPPHSGN